MKTTETTSPSIPTTQTDQENQPSAVGDYTTETTILETRNLPEGIRHEVRSEGIVKEVVHKNGTIVTLLSGDQYYTESIDRTDTQQILRVTKSDGVTFELLNLDAIPGAAFTFIPSISEIQFSPAGTYLVVTTAGYESNRSHFFDLRTGKEVAKKDKDGNPLFSIAKPYWSPDESKLLLLSDSHGIGGCVDCPNIQFSNTGSFDDTITLTNNLENKDIRFDEVSIDNTSAAFFVTETNFDNYPDTEKRVRTTLDFRNMTLRSELTYLNN